MPFGSQLPPTLSCHFSASAQAWGPCPALCLKELGGSGPCALQTPSPATHRSPHQLTSPRGPLHWLCPQSGALLPQIPSTQCHLPVKQRSHPSQSLSCLLCRPHCCLPSAAFSLLRISLLAESSTSAGSFMPLVLTTLSAADQYLLLISLTNHQGLPS